MFGSPCPMEKEASLRILMDRNFRYVHDAFTCGIIPIPENNNASDISTREYRLVHRPASSDRVPIAGMRYVFIHSRIIRKGIQRVIWWVDFSTPFPVIESEMGKGKPPQRAEDRPGSLRLRALGRTKPRTFSVFSCVTSPNLPFDTG